MHKGYIQTGSNPDWQATGDYKKNPSVPWESNVEFRGESQSYGDMRMTEVPGKVHSDIKTTMGVGVTIEILRRGYLNL